MSLRIEAGPAPVVGRLIWEREHASRIDQKMALIDSVVDELRNRDWVVEEDAHWLALCLDEVVVNAILHGNEGDPQLSITLRLYDDDERWILQVDDCGEGFSAEDVPDPEDDSSLMLEHGRGIVIMLQWLDELVYYRGGACAVLARRKGAVDMDMEGDAG